MTVNRSVAALTPFAAVLAGVAAEWLAKHFPGVHVPTSALEEIFLGGMAAVLAPSTVWLLGWQKHEAREGSSADRAEAALELHELALADAEASVADPEGDEEPVEGLDELDLSILDDEDVDPELDELASVELAAATVLDDDEDEFHDELLDDPLDDEVGADEDDDILAGFSSSNSPSAVG